MKLSLHTLQNSLSPNKTLLECPITGIPALLELPALSKNFPTLIYHHPVAVFSTAQEFAKMRISELELLSDSFLSGIALSMASHWLLLRNHENLSGVEKNLLLAGAGTNALIYLIKALGKINAQTLREYELPLLSLSLSTWNTKNNEREGSANSIVKAYTNALNAYVAPHLLPEALAKKHLEDKKASVSIQSSALQMRILSLTRKTSGGTAPVRKDTSFKECEATFQFNKKKGKVLLENAIKKGFFEGETPLLSFMQRLFTKRNLVALGNEKRAELIARLLQKELPELAHIVEISFNPYDAVFSIEDEELESASIAFTPKKTTRFSVQDLLLKKKNAYGAGEAMALETKETKETKETQTPFEEEEKENSFSSEDESGDFNADEL